MSCLYLTFVELLNVSNVWSNRFVKCAKILRMKSVAHIKANRCVIHVDGGFGNCTWFLIKQIVGRTISKRCLPNLMKWQHRCSFFGRPRGKTYVHIQRLRAPPRRFLNWSRWRSNCKPHVVPNGGGLRHVMCNWQTLRKSLVQMLTKPDGQIIKFVNVQIAPRTATIIGDVTIRLPKTLDR